MDANLEGIALITMVLAYARAVLVIAIFFIVAFNLGDLFKSITNFFDARTDFFRAKLESKQSESDLGS